MSPFMKHHFCEKLIFAIPSLRKSRIWNPEHRHFDSEIGKKVTWKQTRTKWNFKLLEVKNLIYTMPKITTKSMKILLRTTSCPSCCSHGPSRWSRGAKMNPPGCSRGAKMGPQNVKMKTPSLPNGNPEEPKGVRGRGHSPEDSPHPRRGSRA